MGYSLLDNRYRFNGVVSTDKTVIQNLEALASAAGCWLTYDVGQGQWGIIINRPGDSVASFNDANIIGSLTVSGTGITDLYNAVRVEFPHIDLADQKDYVRLEIPVERRNANEPDNTLEIQYDILNDPVQAELLATIELNQARVDRIVKFVTDYSNLGLKAGQIIDVTSDIYGFVNKKFRIITLVENDGDDGNITLEITALEYSDTVYDETQLNRYIRTASTGIPTIGNLGIPGTPTVSNFQSGARPHFVVNSTAPVGTVEGMEFWYTTDVPPGVTVDANRAYQLLDTVKPTAGNTFAYGDTVTLDWDRFNSTNFLIKTRAVNALTTGPYSSPSGKIEYAPEQITNTVNENTVAKNSTTGLATALGLLTLVNNLDGLFSGNTAVGGLFNKIFDLHKTKTGANLLSNTGFVSGVQISSNLANLGYSTSINNNVSTIDYVGLAPTSQRIGVWQPAQIGGTVANTYTNTTVITSQVLPYTGGYKLTSSLNWGGSTNPGRLVKKISTVYIGGGANVLYPSGWEGTATGGGEIGSDLYEDQLITTIFSATAGTTISVKLEHYCNYQPYGIFPTFDLEYVGNVRTS